MTKQLGPNDLYQLLDPKNPALLEEYGGAEGLAEKLNTNLVNGLNSIDREKQVLSFGDNKLPEAKSITFLEFVWHALHDKTLNVLMFAAGIELLIGVYKVIKEGDKIALVDGGAILIAILIVVAIGSISDYRKQAQFKALAEFGKSLNLIKVTRDGELIDLQSPDLVVGDIVNVQTGVVLPADGILVSGYEVSCDESAMTGEPHAVDKDLTNDPFLLSGTNVINGVGKMLVTGTGTNSMNGRSMLALDVEAEDTPLQQKLNILANAIANIAFYLAAGMMIILGGVYFLQNISVLKDGQFDKVLEDLTLLFILAVTVVVVAVPEGLPLAVTLSLAHATLQMLKDNNLVRHLSACETMGNATTICSDKTGTLTLNKMTVVQAICMEKRYSSKEAEIFSSLVTKGSSGLIKLFSFIARTMNVNSTAAESKNKDGNLVLGGSKTEIALLEFFKQFGFSFNDDRESTEVVKVIPFSSDRKRMTCVIKIPKDVELEGTMGLDENDTDAREYICVKGASEIVLRACTKVLGPDGKIVPLTAEGMKYYNDLIAEYASEALRTICCAVKPVPVNFASVDSEGNIADDSDLVLVMLFGILDPLRDEVPAAVARCQRAGVVVRMVTGDSAPTARAIARGCGILTPDGLVMEGSEFRKLSEAELDKILPKLQVLARSSPVDKQILVRNLKRLGETVAVTGDGTNDAPALAAADVGFSMGIAGTEVAKQASDIILMDDNFASLVKAVVWGRCVYDAIRKFLQFQLTVNVSAVVITVVTALHTTIDPNYKKPESILTAVQLLWVNLIMDTLAALALATDEPTDELLNRKPSKRTDSIINAEMSMQIIGQALYQIIVCLGAYFIGPTICPREMTDNYPSYCPAIPESASLSEIPYVGFFTGTLVFNIFIFTQVFNEINCRSISSDKNIFKNITKNYVFLGVLVVTVLSQYIIISFGGVVFRLDPSGLNWLGWLISLVVGFGSIIVGFIIRLLPVWKAPAWLLGDSSSKSDAAVLDTKNGHKDTRASGWARIRMYFVTASAFRSHRSGTPQLTDPRKLKSAQVKLAESRSQ